MPPPSLSAAKWASTVSIHRTTHNTQNIYFTNEEDGSAIFQQNNVSGYGTDDMEWEKKRSFNPSNIEGSGRIDAVRENRLEEIADHDDDEDNEDNDHDDDNGETTTPDNIPSSASPLARAIDAEANKNLPKPYTKKEQRIEMILNSTQSSCFDADGWSRSYRKGFLHRHIWPLYDISSAALDIAPASPLGVELHSVIMEIWENMEQDLWKALMQSQYSGKAKKPHTGELFDIVPLRSEEVLLKQLRNMKFAEGKHNANFRRREAAVSTLQEFIREELLPLWRFLRVEDLQCGEEEKALYDGDQNLKFAGGHARIVGLWLDMYQKKLYDLDTQWEGRWEWWDIFALISGLPHRPDFGGRTVF